MKRLLKKEIVRDISDLLKKYRAEVEVKDYPQLRQPGSGMHPYCLRYNKEKDTAMVYPWAGAEFGWEIPTKNIKAFDLYLIKARISTSMAADGHSRAKSVFVAR